MPDVSESEVTQKPTGDEALPTELLRSTNHHSIKNRILRLLFFNFLASPWSVEMYLTDEYPLAINYL